MSTHYALNFQHFRRFLASGVRNNDKIASTGRHIVAASGLFLRFLVLTKQSFYSGGSDKSYELIIKHNGVGIESSCLKNS